MKINNINFAKEIKPKDEIEDNANTGKNDNSNA